MKWKVVLKLHKAIGDAKLMVAVRDAPSTAARRVVKAADSVAPTVVANFVESLAARKEHSATDAARFMEELDDAL